MGAPQRTHAVAATGLRASQASHTSPTVISAEC
jgi:hypothetical protein